MDVDDLDDIGALIPTHIQNNVLPDQESYNCKKCHKRKDNNYNLINNLHPVWFKVNEDGSHKLDEAGKIFPPLRYHKC